MSKDKDTGHNYDGIRELDNQLPKWWLAIFWITIFWGAGYWYYYELGGGPSQVEQYNAGMDQVKQQKALANSKAEKQSAQSGGGVEALIGDSKSIANGKVEFLAKCASCHGKVGEGGIGPNLTDAFWLHGKGDASGIVKVIKEGVAAKGMPPWAAIIPAQKINEVAVYILSLKGSNPPNGKGPQGKEIQ